MKNNENEIYFNTKDVRMGYLKKFNLEHNGMEMDEYGKVFIVKNGDEYFNPLNVFDVYPIYERMPYSNVTMDGESYGCKYRPVQGQIFDGPCVAIDCVSLGSLLSQEKISLSELENIVLDSVDFYKDYEDIVDMQKCNFIKKRKMLKKHQKEIDKLNSFLCGGIKQLKKKIGD